MVGVLQSRAADVAIATLSRTVGRSEVVDFGHSFVLEYWTLVVKRRSNTNVQPHLLGYLEIFNPSARIWIASWFLAMVGVVWALGGINNSHEKIKRDFRLLMETAVLLAALVIQKEVPGVRLEKGAFHFGPLFKEPSRKFLVRSVFLRHFQVMIFFFNI